MKQYILCQGWDYEHRPDKDPFVIFTARRLRQILHYNQRTELRIKTYDFRAGIVRHLDVSASGAKAPRNEERFEPVTLKHYGRLTPDGSINEEELKDNLAKVMSITDVYKAVQLIGKTEPGTLQEVSVFSHGWPDGPILLNSIDDDAVTFPSFGWNSGYSSVWVRRDPDDKDGRARKDFVPPNMETADIAAFKDAFARNGYVWLWGCSHNQAAHAFLTRVHHRIPAAAKDDTLIDLSPLTKEQLNFLWQFRDLFELNPSVVRRTGQLRVPFKPLKIAVWRCFQDSYAFQLVTHTKVRAIAAAFATYAEFFRQGKTDLPNEPLLAIGSDTMRTVNFYQKHFGLQLDPEHRNYGVFEPGMRGPH